MERDYDVVVIGSGAAGLAAAVTAADSGSSVIVLEADDKVGGSSRLSGGHFYAAGTSVQREAGILNDTPDDMFSYYMTLNQWNVEPAVARRYCDDAAPTFEWLRSLGVEYKPERVYISGIDTVPRGHPPEGEGLAVVRVLDSERIKRGVDMALMTRADKLIEEDGEVVGVAAAEGGVFLEQSLLHIEAEVLGFVVGVLGARLLQREGVDLPVAEQHVEERLAAQRRRLGDQLLRPDVFDREALGKLHHLPEIGARLAGRGD